MNEKELIDSERFEQSGSFLDMGFYYLNFVKLIFNKTATSGNKWFAFGNGKSSESDYDKETEFSDFKVMVPTLFNFYHGLELVLKGFLLLKKETSLNHNIGKLYNNFKSEYADQTDIFLLLDKYILTETMIEPLKSFFDNNRITVNRFYDALRYPYDKTLKRKIWAHGIDV